VSSGHFSDSSDDASAAGSWDNPPWEFPHLTAPTCKAFQQFDALTRDFWELFEGTFPILTLPSLSEAA